MKNTKKIFAILVAVLMVAASLSAFAAGTGADTKVTISGLDENDKVEFYKVIKWVGDAEGNANGWAWNDAVVDTTKVPALNTLIDANNALMISSETAGKLSRAIKSGVAADYTVDKVGADGTAEWARPEGDGSSTDNAVEKNMGMYMAIITPAKNDTIYNPVFVSADFNGGGDVTLEPNVSSYNAAEYAAKKSTIPLTKEAKSERGADEDDGDTVYPGDTLDFTVTTKIPGYGDTFDEPFYKLRDTLKDLTLTSDAIVVKVNGTAITEGFTATKAADRKSYEIVFESDYLKDLHQAADLVVEYKATVDELHEGSYANIEKEKNTVELEYSHDPSTEDGAHPGGKKKFQKDITNHYTFSIDANSLISGQTVTRPGESGSELIKVGVDKDGHPITESSTWSNVGDAVVEKVEGTLAGAEFTLTAKDGSGKTWTAISDAEGRINFEGLDAGTYELEETKAPRGYVRDTKKHTIVITATMSEEKSATEYYDQQGNWYDTDADDRDPYTYTYTELESYSISVDGKTGSSYTFGHAFEDKETEIKWSVPTSTELPTSIQNRKGVELPSTGGIGTTIFYVGGSILVLAAAVLLVTKRRMSVEE